MAKKKITAQATVLQPRNYWNNPLTVALFWGVCFVLIYLLLPAIWISRTPAQDYVSIDTPVTTNRQRYNPGEKITLQMQTVVGISTDALSVKELLLISADGQEIQVDTISRQIPLIEGQNDIHMQIRLPEDLERGAYIWEGVFSFEVRGIKKATPWFSTSFVVD